MYFADSTGTHGVQFDGIPQIPHKKPTHKVFSIAADGTERSYARPRSKYESWTLSIVATDAATLAALDSFWTTYGGDGSDAVRWYRYSDAATGSFTSVKIKEISDTEVGPDLFNVTLKIEKDIAP